MARYPRTTSGLPAADSRWLAAQRGSDRATRPRHESSTRRAGGSSPVISSSALHIAALLAVLLFTKATMDMPMPVEETVAVIFEPTAPVQSAAPEQQAHPFEQSRSDAKPLEPLKSTLPPRRPEVEDEDIYRSARVYLPPSKPRTEPVRHTAPARRPEPAPAAAAASLPNVAASTPVVAATVIPPRPVAGIENNRAPGYPEMARRRGEQGRVMLRVNVASNGIPEDVTVSASSGYPILDSAALAAVRQWRFVPATQAGVPVAAVAEVPVRFQLEN